MSDIDIVERLRAHAKPKEWHTPGHPMNAWVLRLSTDDLCELAADEIERLRAALTEAVDACRYALADSPGWRSAAATVVADAEAADR